MKFRQFAKTTALAAVMALGFSCAKPIVEPPRFVKKPNVAQTKKPPKQHPCSEKDFIKGGKSTSCHIMLQIHEDQVKDTIEKDAVLAQLLQYHVLNDLIQNYNVRSVFLEGTEPKADLGKSLKDAHGKRQPMIVFGFERCVKQVDPQIHSKNPELYRKQASVNFCLAYAMWKGKGTSTHYSILSHYHPSTLFTGFERNIKRLKRRIGSSRAMHQLAKKPELLAKSGFADKLSLPTSKHVDRGIYAIQEALLRSSHNSAIVIGRAHKKAMMDFIKQTPIEKRPTFFFIQPQCQDNPDFFISPKIIEAAIKSMKRDTQQSKPENVEK